MMNPTQQPAVLFNAGHNQEQSHDRPRFSYSVAHADAGAGADVDVDADAHTYDGIDDQFAAFDILQDDDSYGFQAPELQILPSSPPTMGMDSSQLALEEAAAIATARAQRHEQPFHVIEPAIVPRATRGPHSDSGWQYSTSQTSTSADSGYQGGSRTARARSRSVKSNNSGVWKISRRGPSHSRMRASSSPLVCNMCSPPRTFLNQSEMEKDRLRHEKPFKCDEKDCRRPHGFATKNDLERHRKAVHHKNPMLGDKHGYICAQCPPPPFNGDKKYWPRKDNFKAHILRRHPNVNPLDLIERSKILRTGAASHISDSALGSQIDVLDEADPLADIRAPSQVPGLSQSAPQDGTDLWDLDSSTDAFFAIGTGQQAITQHPTHHGHLDHRLYIPNASRYGMRANSAVMESFTSMGSSSFEADRLSPLDTQNAHGSFSFTSNGMDLETSPRTLHSAGSGTTATGSFTQYARTPLHTPEPSTTAQFRQFFCQKCRKAADERCNTGGCGYSQYL